MKNQQKLYYILFSCTILFFSCSDLSSTIGADGTYRVAAYIGNMAPETKALVRPEDSIRPSFITDLSTDPDVYSLRVSVLNSHEQLVSEYFYTIETLYDSSDESAELYFVDNLNDKLPSFKLPSGIDPGSYSLVFRVLGRDGLLTESRQYLYYLSDAEFNFKDLRSYPPGKDPSLEKPLFPPGITILLAAEVSADPRLDPYMIWTFGSRIIHEAYLSEGGALLLWETPETEALYSVRARLYPEKPGMDESKAVPFYSKNCSVPVSDTKRARLPGMDASDYDLFFRFLANLYDDGYYLKERQNLVAFSNAAEREARWIPLGNSYGLSVGEGETYTLELEDSFTDLDSLDLYIKLASADYGQIGIVSFNSGMLSGRLVLDFTPEGYLLCLETGEETAQCILPGMVMDRESFLPLRIRLEQSESALIARMVLDNAEKHLSLVTIGSKSDTFSVKSLTLGSKTAETVVPETDVNLDELPAELPFSAAEQERSYGYTALIDEIGFRKNLINLDKKEGL